METVKKSDVFLTQPVFVYNFKADQSFFEGNSNNKSIMKAA